MRGESLTMYRTPDGRMGTIMVLRKMKDIVNDAIRGERSGPELRGLAIQITASVKAKDKIGDLIKISDYVRRNIKYVNDVYQIETLQTPFTTLRLRAGDCDDQSILVATLLKSIGFETRFCAMSFDGINYTHVVCEANVNGKWLTVETTENVAVGWLPEYTKSLLRLLV